MTKLYALVVSILDITSVYWKMNHWFIDGYIDVGDGCWRRNVLTTTLRCWWRFWRFLSPTSSFFEHKRRARLSKRWHQHPLVTNIYVALIDTWINRMNSGSLHFQLMIFMNFFSSHQTKSSWPWRGIYSIQMSKTSIWKML